jgi:hypothetical protein
MFATKRVGAWIESRQEKPFAEGRDASTAVELRFAKLNPRSAWQDSRFQPGKQPSISPVAFQFTGKLPYLVFPRDIHDTAGIVVETFAQQSQEPGFELYPFRDGLGNSDDDGIRTCQSAPADRSRAIKQWLSLYLSHPLRARENTTEGNEKQREKNVWYISTSP